MIPRSQSNSQYSVRSFEDQIKKKILWQSFLRYIPQFAEEILSASQIKSFSANQILQGETSKSDYLLIPVNESLLLKSSSGSFGEDITFAKIPPMRSTSLRSLIFQERMKYKIVVGSRPSHVLLIPKSVIKNILTQIEDSDGLMNLCELSSCFSIAKWLVDRKVPSQAVLSLLSNVERVKLDSQSRFIESNEKGIFLVEGGTLLASRDLEDQRDQVEITTDDWFGGSNCRDWDGRWTWKFEKIKDVTLYNIPRNHVTKFLDKETLKALANEPCITVDNSNSEVAHFRYERSIPTCRLWKAGRLKLMGFKVKVDQIKVEPEYETWTETTLWNASLFLDLEISESQVLSLASAKLVNKETSLGEIAKIFEELGLHCELRKESKKTFVSEGEVRMTFFAGRPSLYFGKNESVVFFLTPDKGLVSVDHDIVDDHWDGVQLQISPTTTQRVFYKQFKSLLNKPDVAGRELLLHFLRRMKGSLQNIAIFKFFLSISVAFIPSFLVSLVNQVLGNQQIDDIYIYGSGVILFSVFQLIALFSSGYFTTYLQSQVKGYVKPYFYKLFLNQPNNFQGAARTGLIQTRLGLIDYAVEGLRSYKIEVIQESLTLLLFIGLVGLYSWQAALLLLLFAACGIGMTLLLRSKGGLDIVQTAQQRQEVIDNQIEFLQGFSSLKSSQSEKWCKDRMDDVFIQLNQGMKAFSKGLASFGSAGKLIFQIGIVLSIYVVISEILRSRESANSVFALSVYLGYLLGPFSSLVNILATYNLNGVMTFPGQLAKADEKEKIKTARVARLNGDIRFEKVSFRYNNMAPASLTEVSFQVKSGDVIAIVGRSGSGKTTLGRAISRQIEPQAGKINFDNIDVRAFEPGILQSQIGIVSQTPALFAGTIAQNIAVSDDSINYKNLNMASQLARLDNIMAQLPGGMNFYLSEGGLGLSVGQRQQIAIARALYDQPRILVLDEATAHLDPITEREILEDLLNHQTQQTVFMITQRISTARMADQILVMKGGRLVEMGTHGELLLASGEYAELFRHQMGGEV